MVGIGAYDSNSIQTLFSSLNTSRSSSWNSGWSSSGMFGINLVDYASIRTGSYGKLLKSYYSEVAASDDSDKSSTSISTAKDSTKNLARVEEASEDLKESADALLKKGSTSVFTKKQVTDEEGNTSYAYDTDKIYKAVKDFADNYNDMLDAAEDSTVSRIRNAASSVIRMTDSNEKRLADFGISVDADNRLVVDEEEFKKADMDQVKSLFQTTGAYGYQVSAQASMIDYYAQNEASKSNTYTGSGMYTYNYSTGEIYNSYM